MKRFLFPVLALLGVLALGLGARWALRRPAPHIAQEADRPPFLIQAEGAGVSIEHQPSEIPIRSLVWSRPLPGGAVVAQVLTQSNRQQALLFIDGRLDTTLTLDRPAGVPENVFNFAELEDAALLPGKALLLLYGPPVPGELPVLIAWNLEKGALQWTYRGAGTRLALSPEGHSAFLFGPDSPVQILSLRGPGGGLAPVPTASKVDLPPDMAGPAELLPTGPADFLATEGTGLAAWKNGAWTRTPASSPSPLGFAPSGGALARSGRTLWWQPEPGRLVQVAADASIIASQDLSGLIPGTHARDASLLHLLGSDPQGNLWFAPVAPEFRAAVPPPGPILAGPTPSGPAPVADPSAAPVVPAPATPSLRETWDPYLKQGLDRLYAWKPGSPGMQGVAWSAVWQTLGAPAYLGIPTGDGGLVPSSGGFLLGGQERRWWLPLGVLPLNQPR